MITEERYQQCIEFSKECWTIKYKCQWCKMPLRNDEKIYHDKGNCCSACSGEFQRSSMSSTDKLRINEDIKEHRRVMDLLAGRLEHVITEEERLIIKSEMEKEFNKIKELKRKLV